MRRSVLIFVFLVLVSINLFVAPTHGFAGVVTTTWYVNVTTGNDLNSGTSSGSPFKTITKAMSVAASGHTINVAAGTYVWAPPPC